MYIKDGVVSPWLWTIKYGYTTQWIYFYYVWGVKPAVDPWKMSCFKWVMEIRCAWRSSIERGGETGQTRVSPSGGCEQEPCYFNRTHPLFRGPHATSQPTEGLVAMPFPSQLAHAFFMGTLSLYTKPTMIHRGHWITGLCCTIEPTIRILSST